MKRKRGAPKGNQNARKHGLYCGSMSPDEMCQFWNILNAQDIDPEVAVLRVKIFSAVKREPGNRRIIRDSAKILAKWYSSKFNLSDPDTNRLRKALLSVLQAGGNGQLVPMEVERAATFLQNNSSVL